MVEPIPNLPPHVVGFRARGTVTAKDYASEIAPAIEAQFARLGKVRFVYHMGEDFTGFEAGAVWDDAKLGFKHIRDWEKIAIVSDVGWVRAAVQIFRPVIPAHVRVFHNAELPAATEWVAA